MTKRRQTASWLLYLAAWGVSSLMVGVLLGRHLKQEAQEDLLPAPARAQKASRRGREVS